MMFPVEWSYLYPEKLIGKYESAIRQYNSFKM